MGHEPIKLGHPIARKARRLVQLARAAAEAQERDDSAYIAWGDHRMAKYNKVRLTKKEATAISTSAFLAKQHPDWPKVKTQIQRALDRVLAKTKEARNGY